MALIALPAKFSFGKIGKWGLVRAGTTIRSRFTGFSQRIVYPYAVWVLEGELIDYPEPEASAIRGFLMALEGQKNTFQFPVPGWTPLTQNMQTPTVVFSVFGNTAARANVMNVAVAGAGVVYDNVEAILPVGSYFTINGELKVVTKYTQDAGGIDYALIEFQPPLRAIALHGTAITVRNPYCTMAAIDDDIGVFSLAPPVKHSISIKAIEAF